MKLELGWHVEQKLTLIQQDRRFSSFVLFQVNLLIRFSLGEIMQFYGKTWLLYISSWMRHYIWENNNFKGLKSIQSKRAKND